MALGTVLQSFFVRLGLSTDQASFASGMAAVRGLEAGLMGVAGAAKAAIKGAYDLIGGVADYGRSVYLAAQKTGLTTDQVQELGAAGEFVGLSMDKLSRRVGIFVSNIRQAAHGGKAASEAFAEMGVSATDETGKMRHWADVMGDVADALQKAGPEDQERLAASLKMFGTRGGMELLPLLRMGRQGIKELMEEAREFGAYLDKDGIAASNEYAKSTWRLGMILKGLKNAAGGAFIKILSDMINRLVAWVKANRELIIQLGKAIGGTFLVFLRTATAAVKLIVTAFEGWANLLSGKFGSDLRTFGYILAGVIATVSLALSPLTRMIAIFSALFLIVEDVVVGLQGGKSVIVPMLRAFRRWLDDVTSFKPGDSGVVLYLKTVANMIANITGAWQAFKETFGLASDEQAGGRRILLQSFAANAPGLSQEARTALIQRAANLSDEDILNLRTPDAIRRLGLSPTAYHPDVLNLGNRTAAGIQTIQIAPNISIQVTAEAGAWEQNLAFVDAVRRAVVSAMNDSARQIESANQRARANP